MSEWSLNNSTGTTDMGLWADPVPGQQDSEAPSSPTVPKMTTGQSIPKHVYPLNIDSDLTDSNGEIYLINSHFGFQLTDSIVYL